MKKLQMLHSFFINFYVFCEIRSQRQLFEGQNARLCSQICFFADFRFSNGPKIDPWTAIFSPTGAKRSSPSVGPGQSEADLGAIWRRKRSKDVLSSIWGRFLFDFGWILIIFERLLMLLFRIPSSFMTLMVLQFWHLFK